MTFLGLVVQIKSLLHRKQRGRKTPEVPPIPPANQPELALPSHGARPAQTNLGLRFLRSELSRAQRMGIPDQKDCFPEDLLSKIINSNTINDALPNAPDDLKAFALSAAKVFAILLQIISEQDEMIQTLESFKYHCFIDDSLPIIEMANCCEVHGLDYCNLQRCSIDSMSTCSHEPELNVFHHYPWDSIRRRDFYSHQWKFLIPSLNLILEDGPQKCASNEILPVVKLNSSEISGSGHFSDVCQGKILTKYQNEVEEEEEWVQIAIKQLKNRNDYIVEQEWIREIDALSKFNKLNHDHITRGIAACKQSDRYYIFLEWANGDNLRKLWTRNPKPLLNDRNIKEFLYQIYGLVDALYHMHNDSEVHEVLNRSGSFVNPKRPSKLTRSSRPGESSSSLSCFSSENSKEIGVIDFANSSPIGNKASSQPQVIVNSATSSLPQAVVGNATPNLPQVVIDSVPSTDSASKSSNWRHGDIKPENILVFKDDSSWIGTLKLGDLGRAKQHQFVTVSPQRRPTGEGYGTEQYEPPEATLSTNKARSRQYDIWSMGCIIFEAIYWLLYGIDEKKAVEAETTTKTPQGTRYWVPDPDCPNDPKAKVNPLTELAINSILASDPACNVESGTVLRDLLLLVKDHLLVVHLPAHLPDPTNLFKSNLKVRTNANTIREKLIAIVARAERDPAYLFTDADRTSVKAPLVVEPSDSGSDITGDPHASSNLPAPSQHLGPLGATAKRLDSYAHEERDIWEFQDDESFASSIIADVNLALQLLQPQSDSTICNICADLDFQSFPLKIQYPILDLDRRAKEGCELCSLLSETARRAGIEETDTAYFECSESTIKLQWGEKPLSLSICQTSTTPMRRIRMGLPSVAASESPTQFAIMRSWVDNCDKHKNCYQPADSNVNCPTRLIDVGSIGSKTIYIIEKASLVDELKRNDFHYVALSHPWGDPKDHEYFTSTKANIEDHKSKGIAIKSLPNTFQGAIKITQHMEVKYMWIDSLCILQGEDGDFDSESKSMEHVFSSAYFTIAASSALGTSSQILGPRPGSVMRGEDAGIDYDRGRVVGQRKIVRLKLKEDSRPIFIAQSLDNFQADVLDGPLNQRGWVFQERALSRRTIYLTETQMYWECGEGIRCETLTKLRNPKVGFLGDPNFPNIAIKLSRGGQIYYYEGLYEQYSRLRFSFKEDRSVAIYGLETRICRALGDKCGYGVFKNNLGRGLLWRRRDANPLVRIVFSQSPKRGRPAPSWSWMSCVGSIEYMSPVGGSVIWNKDISWVLKGGQVTSTLKGFVKDYDIPTGTAESKAKIDMDDAAQSYNKPLRCVVVGTEKLGDDKKRKKHYVLIVRESSRIKGGAVYERVGVGRILGCFIGDDIQDALIQ